MNCFILAQVAYISENEKPVRSASSKNPNVLVMLIAHTYSPEICTFQICGKSGICKAKDILLSCVQQYVEQNEDGCITLSAVPEGYTPFHDKLYIDLQATTPCITTANEQHEECEPYLVEKVVNKRFRNGQYEYLVKWCGYCDKDNTWELHTNIPRPMLSEYEQSHLISQSSHSRREGLRQLKKSTYCDDFIYNM